MLEQPVLKWQTHRHKRHSWTPRPRNSALNQSRCKIPPPRQRNGLLVAQNRLNPHRHRRRRRYIYFPLLI